MALSLILLMEKWRHCQELPLVVQLPTVAVMAIYSLEKVPGLVEVMEYGVTHHLCAIVRALQNYTCSLASL